ncbi:MAG TPA: glycerophosphoryl diester phosphodiesterase membrane domain-containing protein [Candidatus Dormibacteraeota bacterium]|nr:glycerophosphoryl diester phosphodiesterase membrane domain-containing protein [Candidatus Dormibacteraeota bacterium]
MSVPVPALRLRPMTLMDVLDESFRLYRANFPLLAGISIGLAIPGVTLSLLSGGATSAASFYASALTRGGPPSPTGAFNLVIAILSYPVQLALVPFQAGTLFAAAFAIVLGLQPGFRQALRAVISRYWALWALSLLYGVTSIALLCPPLGVWLLTRLVLAVPALFTEQAPLGRAVERSWALTDRAFWRTFAVVFFTALMGYALQTSLAGVFVAAAGVFPGLPVEVRLLLIISVASLMTQLVEPLLALAVTLIYFDARVRREAFDLEMTAYQLAQRPEPQP